MNILFLGTGTSTGVPSLCCTCSVCQSSHPKNKRLRSSVLLQNEGTNILIDTSTDLRQQCLTHQIRSIDHVLYTHHHADHVHGIDELRCFNYFNKMDIPCYGNKSTLEQIQKNFSYIFNGVKPEGGGIPQLTLNELNGDDLFLGGMCITPLDIIHGSLTITGYKVGKAAYITDCNGIPESTLEKIQGLDLLILNALGFKPHPTHFCLSQALEAIEMIRPGRAILTHINHQFDHEAVGKDLPENVSLAYDGLRIEL